jgi:hypothetical protein
VLEAVKLVVACLTASVDENEAHPCTTAVSSDMTAKDLLHSLNIVLVLKSIVPTHGVAILQLGQYTCPSTAVARFPRNSAHPSNSLVCKGFPA